MRTSRLPRVVVSFCALLTAAALPVAARGKAAEAPPLLVVVEATDPVDCDADDVREAIRAELQAPVISAADATGEAEHALLVAISRREIVMSLRPVSRASVLRTIPAPAEPAARRRAIAWLAGNLARDQAGPLAAAPVPIPQPALTPAPAETPPMPALRPATEPPPMPPPAVAPSDPAIAIATAAPPVTPRDAPRWELTAAGGPTATLFYRALSAGAVGDAVYVARGWQLEAQRRGGEGQPFFGAALDAGPEPFHLLGLAGFAGTSRRTGRWLLDATAGAGIEALYERVTNTTVTSSSMTGIESTTEVTFGVRPGLYGRGALTAAYPLAPAVDVVARLAMHLSTGGIDHSYLGTTIGLRVRLP